MIVTFNGFGSSRALRNYKCEVATPITVSQLRCELKTKLSTEKQSDELINLLDSCAFAGDEQLFSEDYLIEKSQTVNILPPVCGG